MRADGVRAIVAEAFYPSDEQALADKTGAALLLLPGERPKPKVPRPIRDVADRIYGAFLMSAAKFCCWQAGFRSASEGTQSCRPSTSMCDGARSWVSSAATAPERRRCSERSSVCTLRWGARSSAPRFFIEPRGE